MPAAPFGLPGDAPPADGAGLDFMGKAGLFANRSKQMTRLADGEVFLADSFSDFEWGLAGPVPASAGYSFPVSSDIDAGKKCEFVYNGGVAPGPDKSRQGFMHAAYGDSLHLAHSRRVPENSYQICVKFSAPG